LRAARFFYIRRKNRKAVRMAVVKTGVHQAGASGRFDLASVASNLDARRY
jgi:hypothetical protein